MLPQSYIDKVKEVSNLKKEIEEFTSLKKLTSNVYAGLCPLHNDTNPSLRYWEQEDSWACMVCHSGVKSEDIYGSDVIAFIQAVKKLNFREAVFYLGDKYGIARPNSINEKILKSKDLKCREYQNNLNIEAINYLKDRGLNENDIKEYRIGYDLAGRITFPLFDKYKNVLGFSNRKIIISKDCNDKYINSNNDMVFNKGKYLYGMHKLDNSFEEIRITEGNFDAILAQIYGARNVVATLGTSFTEEHAKIIIKSNKTPVFILDSDTAGKKALEKSIKFMASKGVYSKLVILEDGKDLADVSKNLKYDIEDYICENSITYGNYFVNKAINKYKNEKVIIESLFNSKLNELKLKHVKEIYTTLNKVPDEDEKIVLKNFIDKEIDIAL